MSPETISYLISLPILHRTIFSKTKFERYISYAKSSSTYQWKYACNIYSWNVNKDVD